MSSEWREITFGDFVAIQRGHDLPDQNRKLGSVPILGSFGITGYHDTVKAKGPGVTIGRSGASFGVAAYTDQDYWPLNTALYVTDFKGNHPKFVFYFMRVFDFSGFNSGSAQPSLNRNNLYPVSIRVPQPNEQMAISKLLAALDDRIALLVETNTTLESIAQALFKSWFVDFDPVRAKVAGLEPEGMDAATAALFPDNFEESELGLVPTGWIIESIANVAEVVKGKSYKSTELAESHHTALVTLKSFSRGGGFRLDGFKPYTGSYKQTQVVVPGDLIIAYTDVTQAAELIGKPAIVVGVEDYQTLVASLDVGIVRTNNPRVSRQYLYGLFRTELFQSHTFAHTSGTTVLHLAKDGVGSYKFACPSQELVQCFSAVTETLSERCQNNIDQMRTLTQLRDTLLPRLISGQLRLPEAEAQIEAVCA
ncbi:restriction endonuclease subunit S [Pseudomonas syringae group genomosp. 3]|uniref:Type I restriction-modification system, S subunit n=1 Tax=Pseudomonas syringae pv. tomato (strain ATCC BAA-871 / DC3000) TaxID=223283 RepID=Q888D9_PSESM|nr:restriction endonuclease subunit S [Pseudomonas syringae group genomosp. 3]AAO54616.1 type I restriction-modification system, S subunit [Pseudomonas syringae pv. tomato str. DC3000]